MKQTIDLGPNHRGLAIVVPFRSLFDLTDVFTETIRFAVYKPQDKTSLNSYMQAVDLELKYHPIIVVVHGHGGRGTNLLYTTIGFIDIKEDIMAPLFPPIATYLADNPKIFLFVAFTGSSELHFVEEIWENCIVCYIACDDPVDMQRMGGIVEDKLAHPSLSVQEIFTSISDKLPPTATMTVIDRLKEPVYLHPRRSKLMKESSSEESDTLSRVRQLSIDRLKELVHLHPRGPELMGTHSGSQGLSGESGYLSHPSGLSIAEQSIDFTGLLEQPIEEELKTKSKGAKESSK